ncbi:MAG: PorT family protein [Prevotellaceae bacterium]|jgi:hypothetical protein|nr:PorT family protein [Prevotellaceae bacterium]
MKKRIIGICVAGLFCLTEAGAQSWDYKVNAGLNFGGSAPFSLPAEVREIEQYSPNAFAPHLALEAIRWINERWGVAAQITWDHKGFTVRDRVKNLYTEIDIEGNSGAQTGNFTGKNTTEVHNIYFTLPVMATYRGSNRWASQAGFYFAYLYRPVFKGQASDGYLRRGSPIGEKINVPNAGFDFSKNQNRFDYGLIVAEECRIYRNVALRGQLTCAFHSLFPDQFKAITFAMRNIYGTLGISYQFSE